MQVLTRLSDAYLMRSFMCCVEGVSDGHTFSTHRYFYCLVFPENFEPQRQSVRFWHIYQSSRFLVDSVSDYLRSISSRYYCLRKAHLYLSICLQAESHFSLFLSLVSRDSFRMKPCCLIDISISFALLSTSQFSKQNVPRLVDLFIDVYLIKKMNVDFHWIERKFIHLISIYYADDRFCEGTTWNSETEKKKKVREKKRINMLIDRLCTQMFMFHLIFEHLIWREHFLPIKSYWRMKTKIRWKIELTCRTTKKCRRWWVWRKIKRNIGRWWK